MKKSLVILSLAAGAAGAAVVMTQDFETLPFPPTGWTKEETSGYWSRENIGAPYNHVAYFQSYGVNGGSGNLITPGYPLTLVSHYATFNYSFRSEGGGTVAAYFRVQRQSGTSWVTVVNRALTKSTTMRSYGYSFTPATAGTHRILIRAQANTKALVFFRVDNIQLESGPFTAVSPTSLGRVKVMYR